MHKKDNVEFMEAWQWTGTGQPLSLSRVPVPEPALGEVLVRVRAAGMCHSDVGELDNPSWAANIHLNPITLGHEIAGEIVGLGGDVEGLVVGDRVGVHPVGATVPGYSRDGGYAEYHVAPVSDVVPLPPGLSYEMGALGTDAGMTSHHAVVVVAGIQPADKVGIIGLGGLGQIGAQLAILRGAEVYVADPSAGARNVAKELGVIEAVDDAAELIGLGLDVVIDFAGFESTVNAAVNAIRIGGTVVMIGMGAHTTSLITADVVHQKAVIRGSSGGTKEDIASMYRYFASGDITPVIEQISFAQVPEGIDRLRNGRVTGRLVVSM